MRLRILSLEIRLKRSSGQGEVNGRPDGHENGQDQGIADRLVPERGRKRIIHDPDRLRAKSEADRVNDEEQDGGRDGSHAELYQGLGCREDSGQPHSTEHRGGDIGYQGEPQ